MFQNDLSGLRGNVFGNDITTQIPLGYNVLGHFGQGQIVANHPIHFANTPAFGTQLPYNCFGTGNVVCNQPGFNAWNCAPQGAQGFGGWNTMPHAAQNFGQFATVPQFGIGCNPYNTLPVNNPFVSIFGTTNPFTGQVVAQNPGVFGQAFTSPYTMTPVNYGWGYNTVACR